MAGWKSADDIVAYQRAVKLRDDIIRLTSEGAVSRDFKFRDQIRNSAASSVSNLAEGFLRYNHGEFAYMSSVARASFGETRNHLLDGKKRGYFSTEDYQRLDRIADRGMAATMGLIKHLKSSDAPKPYWRIEETEDPSSEKPPSQGRTKR